MTIPHLTNPVSVFTLIICIILVMPYLSRKSKIPSIFGLIIAGLIIGPKGTGLLQSTEGVQIFSTVGMLYIMFLAGLEININNFLQTRYKSIFFGTFIFLTPMSIGFTVMFYIYHFQLLPALLVSSIFSTTTLLSFPIASRLNLTKRESTLITIGGTIISDTSVLILLTVLSTAHEGQFNGFFVFQLISLMLLFVIAVLWGLPKVAGWYFRTMKSDYIQQYIFVLVSLFISANLARVAGIEPIVGAFLSGLAFNRVIPKTSQLYSRTFFIGNAIFIPFFLIGVGLLIDLKVLFTGVNTVLLALIFIAISSSGKFLAATVTQKIFHYSIADRNLIFGLTSAHAAATIAIIMIGFQMGMVNEQVLNATILLILISSLVSSIITEKAGHRLLSEETKKNKDIYPKSERILVFASKMETIQNHLDTALLTKSPKAEAVIYPLSIVDDEDEASHLAWMQQFPQHDSKNEAVIIPITRRDVNLSTGITRTIKELMVNTVIIGWSGPGSELHLFFGSVINELVENNRQMFMVVKSDQPLSRMKKIIVVVATNADREYGFTSWVQTILSLSINTGSKLLILAGLETLESIKTRFNSLYKFNDSHFQEFNFYPNFASLPVSLGHSDLLAIIATRPNYVSFHKRELVIRKLLSRFPTNLNVLVLYPEQAENKDQSLS